MTDCTQTRVRHLIQMGCSCDSFCVASKGHRYILSIVHASELSHQDVEIRDRLMDAPLPVRCPTKGLEKDHRFVGAVLTHCAQPMIQACTRHARNFCAQSCQGVYRNESHYSNILHSNLDAFVSRQALAKAIKPGILTRASPKCLALKDDWEQKIPCLRSSTAQVYICCILKCKLAVQSTSATILYLDVDSFHFKSIGFDSAILQRAFDRQV